MLEPLRAGDDRRRLALGAGVELEDLLGAEPVDPRLLQPRRARARRGATRPAATRGRSASRTSSGSAPDPLHHRRAPGRRGRPRCSSMAARVRLGVEARRAATTWLPDEQRCARPDDGTVVVQRPGHHEAAVGLESAAPDGASSSMRRRIAGHDQLRPTRSSRPTSAPSTPATRRRAAARRRGRRRGLVDDRQIAVRPGSSPSSTPTTTGGSASSTMPGQLALGQLADTPAAGMAPSFQQARSATNQSTEFGSATVTKSPSPHARLDESVGHAVAPPFELGPGHRDVGARDGGAVRGGLGQIGQAPWVRDGAHRRRTLRRDSSGRRA